jgi:hypothetical protein
MNFDRRIFITGLAGCTLSAALGRGAHAQQLEMTRSPSMRCWKARSTS